MTEPIIYAAALLVLFFSAQAGAKSSAFAALSWMLSSAFALLLAMRYWYWVTRVASDYETVSLPILATFCFWLLFIVILFVFIKARESCIFEYEAVTTSFVARVLGGLFGTVSGAIFAAALAMTSSLVVPESFPADKPGLLPIALDAVPAMAFRYLETHLAGVNEKDPAHTPLPTATNAEPNLAIVWR